MIKKNLFITFVGLVICFLLISKFLHSKKSSSLSLSTPSQDFAESHLAEWRKNFLNDFLTYNLVHRKEGASLEETLNRIIKAGRLEERNLNKKIILEKAQLFFDKNSSSNPDNLISIFKDSVVPTSSTFKELIRSYESKWEYRKKEALLNGIDPLPYICTVTFLKIMDAHSWGKYKATKQGLNVYTYSSFEDVSLLKGRDVSTFQELEKAQGVFRTFLQEGDNLLITDFGRDFVPEEYKKTCDEY